MTTKPFEAVLMSMLERRIAMINTSEPARVITWDEDTFTISAQPLVRRRVRGPDGVVSAVLKPIIQNVPLMFQGNGSRRIKYPSPVGTTVLLIIASTSLDNWGNGGDVVDPEDDRRHDLTDAIAIGGLLDPTHAADGSATIEFTDDEEIHAGGSDSLAMSADLDKIITALTTAIGTSPSTGVQALTAFKEALEALWTIKGTIVLKGS